jgi:KaiC/GvpD/RAD55 family RecA-like ATPase
MSSTEWQDALLYHAAWGKGSQVFSLVSIEDFDPGDRQNLFAIMERGYVDDSLNPAWVSDEVVRVGKPSQSFTATVLTSGFTGTVGYYASQLRDATAKRYAVAALTRGLNRLNSNDSVAEEVVMEVQSELSLLPKPATTNDDTWTLDEIMNIEIEHAQFTLPNMLRRNERLVLTGSEGGGKSVFVYQLLTGAAFGVDTFTLEKTEPQRVLFLDVENNEMQARGNLDKIVPTLREIAPDATPDWRSMKRRVVDLLSSKDRADVIRRVTHYKPDILYMGTAYKLTDVTDDTHRSVRAIQSVVDRIRQELDCTVIVEHHAGHGHMNDRNNMRPEGSSYWLRWPDFGYGMQPLATDTGKRLMRLGAWRGDRATDRRFPKAVKQGSVMPWQPVYVDEWEALYSARYDN